MEINLTQSLLSYHERVRERTSNVVKCVPPDAIEWTYKAGKFTIGDLIRHIAAIERYMFTETLSGKQSIYNGCGKELADGYENVFRFFNEMHRQSKEILQQLTDEDMNRKCLTPGGYEVPVWKWIRTMTEHEIHHRGQLYVYLNILEVKVPPLFGISAEEVQNSSLKTPKSN
jgi:uncharacterized damage-inducible protein DinB